MFGVNHPPHPSEVTCLTHLSLWVVRGGLKTENVALSIRQLLLVYDAVRNNPHISMAYRNKVNFLLLVHIICGSFVARLSVSSFWGSD